MIFLILMLTLIIQKSVDLGLEIPWTVAGLEFKSVRFEGVSLCLSIAAAHQFTSLRTWGEQI